MQYKRQLVKKSEEIQVSPSMNKNVALVSLLCLRAQRPFSSVDCHHGQFSPLDTNHPRVNKSLSLCLSPSHRSILKTRFYDFSKKENIHSIQSEPTREPTRDPTTLATLYIIPVKVQDILLREILFQQFRETIPSARLSRN